MVATKEIYVNQATLSRGIYDDDQYGDSAPRGSGSDKTLQLVDFTLRPHLNADYFDHVTMKDMEQQATLTDVPLYAIDDMSAVMVRGRQGNGHSGRELALVQKSLAVRGLPMLNGSPRPDHRATHLHDDGAPPQRPPP